MREIKNWKDCSIYDLNLKGDILRKFVKALNKWDPPIKKRKKRLHNKLNIIVRDK